MYLEQRYNFFTPAPFNPGTPGSGSSTLLGTTQQWNIDRTWAIEEIVICLSFNVTTALAATSPTSPQTPDAWDGLAQLLQRITLIVNDGRLPRNAVDISGVGALEWASQVGLNLDRNTWSYLWTQEQSRATAAGTVPVGVYRVFYRVPLAHPQVGEPLRSRLYLPAHTYPQDPILKLQFNTLTGIGFTSAGVLPTLRTDIFLIRRVPTASSEKLLQSTAGSNPTGYIDWDLVETPFVIPLGSGAEQRFALPIPGNYTGLLFRQYKGGSNISRLLNIDTDVGNSIANNLGLETRWRLETAQTPVREWRWKFLQAVNDWGRPAMVLSPGLVVLPTTQAPQVEGFVGIASAGSATIQLSPFMQNWPCQTMDPVGTNAENLFAATSTMINFMADTSFDTGNELGSLLDTNTPANNGLKMELIGTPASVSTNASQINIVGHRLFGDISRWQKF